MSFFVTSEGSGKGADLGGLAGADRICRQTRAAAVGAGDRTCTPTRVRRRPTASSRSMRATASALVLGITRKARASPKASPTCSTATRSKKPASGAASPKSQPSPKKADTIAGPPDDNQRHDILTGSQTDGRGFTDAADHTCHNWTSSTDGSAQIGHPDRTGGGNTSWNSAHASRGCSQESLKTMGGAGLFYCFAPVSSPPTP